MPNQPIGVVLASPFNRLALVSLSILGGVFIFNIRVVVMTSYPELVNLRVERTRLANKLEFGLFTSEDDARKAQDRLNYVNQLIGGACVEEEKGNRS